ncbi:MAG: RDD family protein [Burkholderiaceae bacterium]|nr:RDD family protein [Burkholderiaceae bacterium]
MADSYALVLTGEVLPGFAPDAVWPQLAAHFRMEPQKLTELLARAPRIVKQSDDLGKLQNMQAGIAQAGAKAEICTPDIRPQLYVLVDGTPRGPVPYALVEQRVKQGLWAASISVVDVGATEWKPFREPDAAAPQPQPTPELTPAASANKWAPPAAPLVGSGNALTGTGDWNELPAGEAIHAGFWRRWAAYMLDSLVMMVPGMILGLLPIIGPIVGNWLYFALMESSSWQATLGKRAMGIKVVDAQGGRIGFGRATGRFFGKIVSALIFCIGYMMAGWTGRKQSLHDMMAGAFVVFNAVQPAQPLPAQRPPMPWYGWVLNLLPLSLAPIGILAAIALPAYQDYTVRAKLYEVVASAEPVKAEVASQGCQARSHAPSNPWVEKVEIGPDDSGSCTIVLTLGQARDIPAPVRGGEIEWTRKEGGGWACSSSLPQRYLPAQCRH